MWALDSGDVGAARDPQLQPIQGNPAPGETLTFRSLGSFLVLIKGHDDIVMKGSRRIAKREGVLQGVL